MVRGGYKIIEDRIAFVLSNDEIIEKCKTEMMESFIAHQQKGLLVHIVRREDSSYGKEVVPPRYEKQCYNAKESSRTNFTVER